MRRWWIVPALAGVLAIAGLGYWGYGLSQDKQQMVTLLNNRNQRAFFEMVGHVENVETMLSKGIISNSPNQRMMIFADIWRQAYAAQENLTEIPMTDLSRTRTSRFLTQTGDYAWSLAQKHARGKKLEQTDVAKLNKLHTEAGFLTAELQKIERSARDGRLTWGEIKTASNTRLRNQVPPVPISLQQVDRTMQEFPTLIYDGPYSEHVINRRPRGLSGEMISRERAADTAVNFAESGSGKKLRAVRTDNVNGTIPAYRVHLTQPNAESPVMVVDVTKKGGQVLEMLNMRPVDKAGVTPVKAVEIARKFLADRKLANMQPTYMLEQQNTGIVIFQYRKNGVLVYPDLMKVKVALDNGDVIGFEGTGFIMNHHDRQLPKPKISEQKAREKVNPSLKITSSRLAVIPLENLQEVLTYEFRGSINGDTFIVYINAQTGEEERILKVIESNGGPVAM